MKLQRVTAAEEIRKAYGVLSRRLRHGTKGCPRTIGYRGGRVTKPVRWHPEHRFWSLIEAGETWWCPFGTQDPSAHEALRITCEINCPKTGTDGRNGGVFWRRGEKLYLGHTGRVGGGRAGIGEKAFLSWYANHYGLESSDDIVIGEVSSPGFLKDLEAFIRAVDEFKAQIVNPESIDDQLDRDAKNASEEGEFDLTNMVGSRQKALRSINVRRGQPAFRGKLLAAYDQSCAVCDCDCAQVLEAAHIRPYGGSDTNQIQNGILLRGDIHTLFDLGKIGIDPTEFRIVVSNDLMTTSYGKLHGRKLRHLPPSRRHWPSETLLREHLQRWKLS